MNTRRLTKKYKHKSRSKRSKRSRKTRRSGRSGRNGRRIMKGGVPSRGLIVRSSVRPISGRPISGRPSSASVRPSSSAGISKPHNFNFECFYKKLMNTPLGQLPSTIQDNKYMYIKNTTFQTFEHKGGYLNMTGLKFVNYLYGKYQYSNTTDKEKIRSIISLFDQYGMAQGVRYSDLDIIGKNVKLEYFNLYKELYDEIYKKLFPNRNPRNYPVSLSAIPLYCKPRLHTVHEEK